MFTTGWKGAEKRRIRKTGEAELVEVAFTSKVLGIPQKLLFLMIRSKLRCIVNAYEEGTKIRVLLS